jgi:hypothetical protein
MPITITTEEGGEVLVDVVLEPYELTGRHGIEVKHYERAEPLGYIAPEDGATAVDLLTSRIANLEVLQDDAIAERDHYRAEAGRLAKLLEQIGNERAVTRYLDADEAREVAAALWHYAGETERPR